jgi:tight adherence protein B
MSPLAACAVLALAAWAHGAVRQARSPVPRRGRPRRRPTPSAGEWAALLDRMAAEVRMGASLTTALDTALAHGTLPAPGASAEPHDDETFVAHAIDTARALGGPAAATLDAAAAQLRERMALRAEAQVHSAQARLSARVLTAVPVVFCLWNVATSPAVRAAWLGPIGMVCAAVGAVLNLSGWWWMRRIVARVAR